MWEDALLKALQQAACAHSTHMLVYIRWPFCWFCRRVFAKSMGNTQVTPISPAIPPLISLAGKL